jgi:hypothetical protein
MSFTGNSLPQPLYRPITSGMSGISALQPSARPMFSGISLSLLDTLADLATQEIVKPFNLTGEKV